MKRVKNIVWAATGLLWSALMLTGCDRRELYVFGDEYHSVTLHVDWRDYVTPDPGGMTVWFYPLSADAAPGYYYQFTTAEVRRHELYLPGGNYQGMVIDYSPEEYSRQQFLGMDALSTARVEAAPAPYQPDSLSVAGEGVPAAVSRSVNTALFGDSAWTGLHTSRPSVSGTTGLYAVAAHPEEMALDTLLDQDIEQGEYGDYIPKKERDYYQSTLVVTDLYARPHSLVWQFRVRVHIRSGFNYIWQTKGSMSGLSDGHWLARHVNTDSPCLVSIDDWETERTGDNEGYVAVTFTTFGLRPGSIVAEPSRYDDEDPWYSYRYNLSLPEELRFNLAFVLRDEATVCSYHFDVGHLVVSYDAQQVLRLDLDTDDINLPYVEAKGGAGFDADVDPWDDQPETEIVM